MKNMLKKLLLVSLCLGFVVGCGSSNIDLDLDKVKEDLANLKMDEISVSAAAGNLDSYFSGAEFIYEYDFNEKFGLNSEDIEEYAVAINEDTTDMYFILRPVDGKKEEVKETMNSYFEQLLTTQTDEAIIAKLENRSEEEYQGVLIYVVSYKNSEIIDIIKNSQNSVFGMMMYTDDEGLTQNFNISSDDVQEYLIATPMMIVNSNTYIIIKPKSDKKDDIKKAIDEYMSNLETQWSTYLPDQYELVKNRLEKEEGGYLIYIVSSDNDRVYNTIIK